MKGESKYEVSYIASAPEEFKVGDRVVVIDEKDNMFEQNAVVTKLDDFYVTIRFAGFAECQYNPKALRKLPVTIRFDEGNKDEPWNVGMFRSIANQMADTYARKNATYNDSFGKSVEKYGFISALTRMSDKFNRIENLILGAKNKVPDESLEDTLIDLACYSVMTVIAMRDANIGEVDFENVK